MTWPEALSFLNSLVNYEQTGGYTKSLEPFRELLARLGNPHEARARKLLIVGTKGKGSVVAHICRALVNAGFTVGAYTSPHMLDLAERIAIQGEPIDHDELAMLIGRIKPYVQARHGYATYFEILTAAAFICFGERKVDWWVLEAGLGGRLDATNAVHQEITVITRLGLDHTHVLGHTIPEIAREKSAVIKGGVVITCGQEPEAMAVVEEYCGRARARLVVPDFSVARSDLTGNEISLGGKTFRTPLPGLFQTENLALSCAALGEMGVDELDFSGVSHPGRFQVVPGDVPAILDGAHNPLALKELISEVSRLFPGKGMVVVFGSSRLKDTGGMLGLLRGARLVILTRANTPRAGEPFMFARDAGRFGLDFARTRAVPEALCLARERARPGEIILVTGSLYVVGEALGWLAGSRVGPVKPEHS